MLHIILALSNSAEQKSEGEACLRFGNSCSSMKINPDKNPFEKEQAQMRELVKQQMVEIDDLKAENEELKR